MFALINVLISVGLIVIDVVSGTAQKETGFGVPTGLYTLGIFVPSLLRSPCAGSTTSGAAEAAAPA